MEGIRDPVVSGPNLESVAPKRCLEIGRDVRYDRATLRYGKTGEFRPPSRFK